jgi:dihydrofolate reductase
MNNTQKYVASTTLESPEWQNTTVLEGDVGEAVSRLKQKDGETITLNGSAALLRSLLRAELVDELRLFLHPVVRGSGRRLFDDGEDLGALKLTECRAYDTGVVSLTYQPTDR